MKKKFYAVKVGKTPGIYMNWDDCKAQINGFSGAIYKSFPDIEAAKAYIEQASEINPSITTANEATMDFSLLKADEAIAYVDGSYNAETKAFSYGVVFITNNGELHLTKAYTNSDMSSMRNVAGEIMGSQAAMEYALKAGYKKLSIYHDYQGISCWCLGEWKANLSYTQEYQKFYNSIKDRLNVSFIKVKGHSNNKYNDLADALAKSSIF